MIFLLSPQMLAAILVPRLSYQSRTCSRIPQNQTVAWQPREVAGDEVAARLLSRSQPTVTIAILVWVTNSDTTPRYFFLHVYSSHVPEDACIVMVRVDNLLSIISPHIYISVFASTHCASSFTNTHTCTHTCTRTDKTTSNT